MRLYVMRHGPAEDRASSGRDADRKLTAAGRAVVERVATALRAAHGAAPLQVLSSPYTRAQETADIVASRLAVRAIVTRDELAGDAGLPLHLVRDLLTAGDDTLLVGHQPTVEALVRELIHPALPALPAGFRTATIVVLDAVDQPPRGTWRVSSILTP